MSGVQLPSSFGCIMPLFYPKRFSCDTSSLGYTTSMQGGCRDGLYGRACRSHFPLTIHGRVQDRSSITDISETWAAVLTRINFRRQFLSPGSVTSRPQSQLVLAAA